MIASAREARKKAEAHLRAEGSSLVVASASWDAAHGVWVVSYRDPAHPGEPLDGGALVVTDAGEVHDVGSTPDALDRLVVTLGLRSDTVDDVWEREGEGLALLADLDAQEAEGLAAWAASRRRRGGEPPAPA